MTAFELVKRYLIEYDDMLPTAGNEYTEIALLAARLHVDAPEPDSIVAVVQMMRQRESEALCREAGQMTLI